LEKKAVIVHFPFLNSKHAVNLVPNSRKQAVRIKLVKQAVNYQAISALDSTVMVLQTWTYQVRVIL
jgi:hypothetical protein